MLATIEALSRSQVELAFQILDELQRESYNPLVIPLPQLVPKELQHLQSEDWETLGNALELLLLEQLDLGVH